MTVLKFVYILLFAFPNMDLNVAQLVQPEIKPEELDDVFRSANIVPTIIPYSPAELLYVTYPEAKVNYGNSLHVLDTLIKPQVSWTDTDEDAEPDSLYTLMFFNLDMGEPYFLHWMVNNILHGDMGKALVTKKYKFPDPPGRPEPYTMLFLVYRQPELEPYSYEAEDFLGRRPDRGYFSVKDFLTSYNFTEFPVAGNFFVQEARLDTWVPLNPPDWMKPFVQYITTHPHDMHESK